MATEHTGGDQMGPARSVWWQPEMEHAGKYGILRSIWTLYPLSTLTPEVAVLMCLFGRCAH